MLIEVPPNLLQPSDEDIVCESPDQTVTFDCSAEINTEGYIHSIKVEDTEDCGDACGLDSLQVDVKITGVRNPSVV